MKKVSRAASAALLVFTPVLLAQGKPATKSAATPVPAGGMSVTTSTTKPPSGSKQAEIQDIRLVTQETDDPYELERLGVAAAGANELTHARDFLERVWQEETGFALPQARGGSPLS